MSRLPTNAKDRKGIPLAAVLDYFPDALCDLARLILAGQVQHNTPGWARGVSNDHADCELRHFLERGTRDTDGMRHSTKRAWRALADLQLEIEASEGLPPSRGSVQPLTPAQTDGINELPEPLNTTARMGDTWLHADGTSHAIGDPCPQCRERRLPRFCRRCWAGLSPFEDEVCAECIGR